MAKPCLRLESRMRVQAMAPELHVPGQELDPNRAAQFFAVSGLLREDEHLGTQQKDSESVLRALNAVPQRLDTAAAILGASALADSARAEPLVQSVILALREVHDEGRDAAAFACLLPPTLRAAATDALEKGLAWRHQPVDRRLPAAVSAVPGPNKLGNFTGPLTMGKFTAEKLRTIEESTHDRSCDRCNETCR